MAHLDEGVKIPDDVNINMSGRESMRLGVYCDDARATALLTAWARDAEFVIVPVSHADPLPRLPLRSITLRPQWEDLLTDMQLDAVFLGGARPEILEAARRLAQAGKPLWILPHPAQGLLFSYELNLAAQETQAPLKAVFPYRADSAWSQGWRGGTETALVPDYVEFLRRLPAKAGETTLMQADVEQHLLMDLDLLTCLLGRRSRVTTLRTGEAPPKLRRQSVTLAGEDVPEILWSMEPAEGSTDVAECRFHVGGTSLIYRESNGVWLREGSVSASATPVPRFAEVVPWSDAVTAFELFDAIEHSLERKRTIELHREPVSERAIFKTRMAAWGCGVLLLTLFLMIAFLMVASVVPLNGTLLVIGRAAVFAPLFLFLLSQALYPLTRAASKIPDGPHQT